MHGSARDPAGAAAAAASFEAPASGLAMRTPPAAVASSTSDQAPLMFVAFFAHSTMSPLLVAGVDSAAQIETAELSAISSARTHVETRRAKRLSIGSPEEVMVKCDETRE